MESSDFNTWPLHDAPLDKITIDWENKFCQFDLDIFIQSGSDAIPHKIIWSDLIEINIPCRYPWGKSIFINSNRKKGLNEYIIEMQSGDEIKIIAEKIELFEVK